MMAAAKKIETVDTTNTVTEAPKKEYPTTEQMIKDGLTTKSARIRKLHELGMPTGDIARQETGGLYQHAYNVIKKPLKRPEVKAEKVEAPAKEETPKAASRARQTASTTKSK